jgi:methyltransferase (TIGR00027 family)
MDIDPIAKTAYYCCGVRADDARGARPVCGDRFAERFMDGEGRAVFDRFRRFKGPNGSNLARCRVIDDLLRERLIAQPQTTVVLLGAGFDTRAFRLRGGRWLELDQPALIAIKEAKLPAREAPNPLQRVAIDFRRDRLEDVLARWTGTRPSVVVMEGVTMYVDPQPLLATLRTARRVFPAHTLICDLMTRTFARRFGGPLRREIAELGGDFGELVDDPAALVAAAGYRLVGTRSIPGAAVDLGTVRLPRWLLDTLLRSLRDGYQVFVFE